MFSFWKKKQPVPPPLPLGVYPLVKAKKNIVNNQEQKRKQCLDILLGAFNENIDDSTKRGLPWACFTVINAQLAHEQFMEMLRKEGYAPTCQIVETKNTFETQYKYTVRIAVS
jgi:hypothetical protein